LGEEKKKKIGIRKGVDQAFSRKKKKMVFVLMGGKEHEGEKEALSYSLGQRG